MQPPSPSTSGQSVPLSTSKKISNVEIKIADTGNEFIDLANSLSSITSSANYYSKNFPFVIYLSK